MPQLAAVARNALADEVTERLRRAIQDGDFAPGEHLVEEALARSLSVSRGPVREALRQLELEGLVATHRNRGSFVAQLRPEDIEELYSIRFALEPLAMRAAVTRATEEDIARLRGIVDRIRAATASGLGVREASQIDIEFHDGIYRASHSPKLCKIWELLKPQILLFLMSRNTLFPNYVDIIVPEHQGLLDAIALRQQSRAVKLLTRHLKGAYDEIMTILAAERRPA